MRPPIRQQCPVCWKMVRPAVAHGFAFYNGHRDNLGLERCPMSWKPYELTGPYTIDSTVIGTLRGAA